MLFAPELLTFREFRSQVNPKSKYHEDHAYNYDLSRFRQSKKEYDNLIQRVKRNAIYFELRSYTDKWGLHLGIFHNDQCVGVAQDEWGTVLVMVASEYRGFGLGKILIDHYYQAYPNKETGGETYNGQKLLFQYYQGCVSKALKNGVYRKLIKNGQLSIQRVKEILASAQLKDKRHKEKDRNTDDPNNWLVYGDEYGQFIIYDQSFYNMEHSYEDGEFFWFERTIKGTIYSQIIGHQPDKAILWLFGADHPKLKSLLIGFTIRYHMEDNAILYLDEPDIQFLHEDHGTLGEPSLVTGFKRYPVTPKTPPNYKNLIAYENQYRKQRDSYDEQRNNLISLAEGKYRKA